MRAQAGMERFANETGGTFFLPAFAPTGTKDALQNASNMKKNEATLDRIFKQLASDLSRVEDALNALRGLRNGTAGSGKRSGRRKLSAAGRAAIIAAQKKRWAKHKAAK